MSVNEVANYKPYNENRKIIFLQGEDHLILECRGWLVVLVGTDYLPLKMGIKNIIFKCCTARFTVYM